jgi:site-specific DNA-cytosine methylase
VARACSVAFSGDKGDGGINTTLVAFNNKHVAPGDTTDTLRSDSHGAVPMVAGFDWQSGGDVRHNITEDGSPSLQANQTTAAMTAMGVRRLTPVECERLMSWPDDHTRYGMSGKEMSDSTRYRMCGNGVVSNVAEWIARRIREVLA